MHITKCFFPSGATGAVTGLLFHFDHVVQDGSMDLVVAPVPLDTHHGVLAGNPPTLSTDGRFWKSFIIAAQGPASGTGGGTAGVYSYWINLA